jgi:hypothetical protein
VDLISTGIEAETADAHTGKWSEENAPSPGSRSHFAVHTSHADIVALGASHLHRIVGGTCIRGILSVIFELILLLGGWGFDQFLIGIWCFLFGVGRVVGLLSESAIGIVDGEERHLIFINYS